MDERHRLSGVLTAYPLDAGVLDWLLDSDFVGGSRSKLEARREDPAFVGGFTSAAQEHYHYEDGRREAGDPPTPSS